MSLSCTGLPAGVTCGYSPASVTPPANGSATSALTRLGRRLRPPPAPTRSRPSGVGGALARTANIDADGDRHGGGGDLVATFDAARQAPALHHGRPLVRLRRVAAARPRRPRARSPTSPTRSTTPARTAPRARSTPTSPTTASRSRPSTARNFAPGKTVTHRRPPSGPGRTPSARRGSTSTTRPTPAARPGRSSATLDAHRRPARRRSAATYTLPAGALQAVRAQFRYQGTRAACAAGAYNDRDDLVFAVDQRAGRRPCSSTTSRPASGWTTNPNGTDTAHHRAVGARRPRGDHVQRRQAARHHRQRRQRPRHGPPGRRLGRRQRRRRRHHHDPVSARSRCRPRAR